MDTFEYRKVREKKPFRIINSEMIECDYNYLFGELKDNIVTGIFYHTTDTNQFFYDWKGNRYEVFLFNTNEYESLNSIKASINELKKSQSITDEQLSLVNKLEKDVLTLESKIENIENTLMIDTDGDGVDESTIGDVIISMNDAIQKLDKIDVPYKVENGKMVVEVNGVKQELCTKEYVDNLFASLT